MVAATATNVARDGQLQAWKRQRRRCTRAARTRASSPAAYAPATAVTPLVRPAAKVASQSFTGTPKSNSSLSFKAKKKSEITLP